MMRALMSVLSSAVRAKIAGCGLGWILTLGALGFGPILYPLSIGRAAQCPGDCSADGTVTVDEIVTLVLIALLQREVGVCLPADTNGDGQVTVDEIVRAVRALLDPGVCPAVNGGTPTQTPTATAVVTVVPSNTPTGAPPPVIVLGSCDPPAVPGQTLVANVSTGQGLTAAALPDPFWRFVPPPPIPATGPIPFTTTPSSSWVSPPAGSWWIQPSSSGSPSVGPSASYEVQVFLPPPLSQYAALRIVGQYAADNTVPSIQWNGVTIGSCTPSSSNCFSSLQPLNFTSSPPSAPFVGGLNTLRFSVANISNITGFLFHGRIEADCPSATPTPTLASTSTPTPSRTVTRTALSTVTPSGTRTGTSTRTSTPTASQAPTRTPTASATATVSLSPTRTPSPRPTASVTVTATDTPSVTPSGVSPTPTATPTCVGLPSGAVAWWPLDDAAGASQVLDIGGGAHHGVPQPGPVSSTFGGGPVTIAGKMLTALYFSSGNEVVEVPPATQFDLAQADYTIDAWFAAFLPGTPSFGGIPNWSAGQTMHYAILDKVDPSTGSGFAFSVRTAASPALPPNPPNGFVVNVNAELCLHEGAGSSCAPLYSGIATWDASTLSFQPLNPPWPYAGQWLHVAVAVDRAAGTGQFFLQGAPLGLPFAPATGVSNNSLPLWLGRSRLTASGFEFALDEIEVFDRALSPAEIAALAGMGGKCKTPTVLPATPTSTPTPTFEGECRFVGPRMCGGSCPNPNEVCMPKPDDSGCACVSMSPHTPTATASLGCPGAVCTATPTRTPTRTATLPATRSPTASATATRSFTPTPRLSPTSTNTQTGSVTPSRTPSPQPSRTPTVSPSATASRTSTSTPRPSNTPTRTVSLTPTAPDCPGAVCTATPTRTTARTATRTPSATPTPCFAEVCVTKFWDLNGNGQNDGEPGLGGWTIQFYNAANTLVTTAVTSPSGTICVGVPGGATYTVQEVLQGGCVQTYPTPPGTHAIFVECGQLVNIQFGNRCPLPTASATPSPPRTSTPTRTRTRTPTSIVPPID